MIISPQTTNKIVKHATNFVRDMNNSDALLPIVLLETAVTAGRTYQAYKRGGKDEARERGIEETIGAVFWLGGVTAFSKLGDKLGKSIMKLPTTNFDVNLDPVRNPLNNFLKKFKNLSKNQLIGFKFAKIAASILLANAFVGFIVPKVNHKITNHFKKKDQEQKKPLQQRTDINSFIEKSKNKGLTFKGLADNMRSLTHCFENVAAYKLLSTDVGIASGRAINARNQHERREILFRDLSSIYFYMFCRPQLNALLNKMEDGRTTRLDPVSANHASTRMEAFMKKAGKTSLTPDEFKLAMLGKDNAVLPQGLKFTRHAKSKIETILLKDFEAVEKDKNIIKLARKMAKLQPETIDGAILTKAQLTDVYKGGAINSPGFLRRIFSIATGGSSNDPYKFVSQKNLDKIKKDLVDYTDDIYKKAKSAGQDITVDTIKKAKKSNLVKNAFNLGLGFAVCGLFLSTLIPKMQYWLTKWHTGKDEFPGTATDLTEIHHKKA